MIGLWPGCAIARGPDQDFVNAQTGSGQAGLHSKELRSRYDGWYITMPELFGVDIFKDNFTKYLPETDQFLMVMSEALGLHSHLSVL